MRELPPRRRRALQRAIRRGEAVADPRDAELAADVAANAQRLRRLNGWHRRRWALLLHLSATLSGAYALTQGDWILGAVLIGIWPYLFQMSWLFGRVAEKAKAAEVKNRALAGTWRTAQT